MNFPILFTLIQVDRAGALTFHQDMLLPKPVLGDFNLSCQTLIDNEARCANQSQIVSHDYKVQDRRQKPTLRRSTRATWAKSYYWTTQDHSSPSERNHHIWTYAQCSWMNKNLLHSSLVSSCIGGSLLYPSPILFDRLDLTRNLYHLCRSFAYSLLHIHQSYQSRMNPEH